MAKNSLLEVFGGGRRTIGKEVTPMSDAAFVVIVLVLIAILLGKDHDDGKKGPKD